MMLQHVYDMEEAEEIPVPRFETNVRGQLHANSFTVQEM